MKSSTCRDNSGNAMSLDHEVLEARISLRVAELRVLAAETFARATRRGAYRPARRPVALDPTISRVSTTGRVATGSSRDT
jgi:hypothetical protein